MSTLKFIFGIFILKILFINCRQIQLVENKNNCLNDEYFNINLLKCIKCEQLTYQTSEIDFYLNNFVNLPNNYQSSRNNSFDIFKLNQSSLQKSKDGLTCECKKNFFSYKKRNSKLINEKICLPCPDLMINSLNGNSCAFCKTIPNIYLKDQFKENLNKNNCEVCSENEILVESIISLDDYNKLNLTKLTNYNYSSILNFSDPMNLIIQKCKKCPKQTKNFNNQCKSCHFSFDNCRCSSENGLILSKGVCVIKNQFSNLGQDLFFINYTKPEQNQQNIKLSNFIANNFHSAFSQCKYYHNLTACQQIANFCVLNHYNFKLNKPNFDRLYTNNLENYELNTICDVYQTMIKQIPINYLPQLYFKDENTKDYLFKTNLPVTFKLNEKIKFYITIFNANGKYIDSKEIYLDELLICTSKDEQMDSFARFAININFNCEIKINRLYENTALNEDEQYFYELYLFLNQTSINQTTDLKQKNNLLYPIYVLNRNLIKNDQFVNYEEYYLEYFNFYLDNSNYYSELINRWQLVKRFFISEQITSKNQLNLSDYGETLRFISKFQLLIRSNSLNANQIYPPLLILEYDEVNKQQFKETVKIELKINFESNESEMYKKTTIVLSIFSSLGVLFSLFKTWAWAKRSNHNTLNLSILFKFILFNCDYLSIIFFTFIFIISVYSFLIYKLQTIVYCFLPSKSFEHSIQIYLIISLILKLISILHEFYIRSDIDIFFIDWEKSKPTKNLKEKKETELNGVNDFNHENEIFRVLNHQNQMNGNVNGNYPNSSSSENLYQKLLNKKQEEKNNFFKQINNNTKNTDHYPEVSIWRTLFVANEWIELCSYRRISTNYHFIMLIIALHCIGIENYAKANLEFNQNLTENLKKVSFSFTNRLATGGLSFLIIVMIQFLFTRFYSEKFMCDKIKEFVDFCSVCNVSIFCLIYKKYGYYIHGRNPTGKSEVNMPEMHQNLLIEEEDLCSKRGLLTNSDTQCFQIFLNDKLVINYNKIREILKQKTQDGLRVALRKVNVQKIWYSYYLMNKLLSGFIDHTFVEMDYFVKEKTFFENLLDAELNDSQMIERSIFYLDKNHSFENVLFTGLEFDIIFLELIFFLFIDLLTYNFISAIAYTFVFDQVLEKIFIILARKNLIRKSLVDERFLL